MILTKTEQVTKDRKKLLKSFLSYLGPALMVSIAYMDPGNYGTDLAAGSIFKYDLVWAVWLASLIAMLLQYLSGKLGIALGKSLPEMLRSSLGKNVFIIPYWLAAELAAAATDLAEYLGTVIALNILFGIPLLYASVIGALDVIILLGMMSRRFRFIERFFMTLIIVLVAGFLYQLIAVRPDPLQVVYHSFIPSRVSNEALLLVVGIIGATVMPHALFVHSWLSRNKMDLTGSESKERYDSKSATIDIRERTRKFHLFETISMLTIAGFVNVGILLVSTALTPEQGGTIQQAVSGLTNLFGRAVGTVFVVTLLASGLTSSTLGTIAGQAIMEGLLGTKINIWLRRIVTRFVNVFPTTLAIFFGIDPLSLLVYSQVILSMMIPLPMIPLVYYTSKKKYMGIFVNRKVTVVISVISVIVIICFNGFLILKTFT
jgi:manganese transport protein